MPDRLPRELRVLYDVARVVGVGPYAYEEVLARVVDGVREDFGFAHVRFVHDGDPVREEDAAVLDEARREERAAVCGDRLAVPLLVEGERIGCLVADCDGETFDPSEYELQLLSAVGLIAGVFLAKAAQYSALQRALEELRRVDELKDDFVSIASHELRTPIAIVHGIAATLHERGAEIDEERRAELREALYAQSGQLRDLTEQLLDLSRFDAGRIHVAAEPFRPRASVDSLVARIVPGQAEQVAVEIDPALEVVADPHAFERVVGNLVGNAFKYGAPPVLVRGESGDGSFRLLVEDRGPGVDPRFASQLFERFTRSDASRRDGDGGAGLGLAIAQQYAEALGGDLRYEPAEPRGARFVLELPR